MSTPEQNATEPTVKLIVQHDNRTEQIIARSVRIEIEDNDKRTKIYGNHTSKKYVPGMLRNTAASIAHRKRNGLPEVTDLTPIDQRAKPKRTPSGKGAPPKTTTRLGRLVHSLLSLCRIKPKA
jgi:hypothetical protein